MASYLSKADQACFTCTLTKCNSSSVGCARSQLLKQDPENGRDSFGLMRNAGPVINSEETYIDQRDVPESDVRFTLHL